MATIFGIIMLVSIAAVLWCAIMLILRVLGKSKFRHTGKILTAAIVIGIASFVIIGITYEPKTAIHTNSVKKEDQKPTTPATVSLEPKIAESENGAGTETKVAGDESAKDIPSQSKAPAQSNVPIITPERPEPPAKPDYEAMLEDLKTKVLSNVKEAVNGKFDSEKKPAVIFDPFSGIVSIEARAADNFTKSWIRKGIAYDIANTLQAISLDEKGFNYVSDRKSAPVYGIEKVIFVITFPMIDAYGKESEGTIVSATYTRKTLEAIVWKNKSSIDFEKIADKYWISPALEK